MRPSRPTSPVLRRALAATVALLALVPAAASAATVSGTVFNDFNTDGVRGTGAPAGAVDRGVAGLTVRAIDAAGTVVATQVTGATGGYSLTAPNGPVRIELVVANGYQPSRQLATLRSDVRFVNAATAQTGVDFGVHKALEYSVDNPALYYPNNWPGPVSPSRTQTAIRAVPFFGPTGYSGTFAGLTGTQSLATFGQVGTVYGLGLDQAAGDLYAGAYYKRFAGLTPDGAGAIFRVTQGNAVTTWARLAAGPDDHPTSPNIADWVSGPTTDVSWDVVGTRGLGSVKVDQTGGNLYTINLFDKRLVRLPLGTAPGAVPAGTGTVIPDPGCTGGAWRPFSVGIDPGTGVLYVGGVCNAITTQATGDLEAVVYRVGNPAGTPTFTQALRFDLDYPRVAHGTGAFNPNNSDWQPWPTSASIAPATTPPGSGRGDRTTPYGAVHKNTESYPALSDITFDADGSMQIGFRDLMGDMSGHRVPGETGTPETPIVQGDILRACPNGGGGFALENAGVCGGVTGTVADPVHGGPIGPGGGSFYDIRTGYNANGGNLGEIAQYQGSQLQVPGFAEVATTYVDPGNQLFADGVLWQSNANGADRRGFSNRVFTGTTQANENVNFSKANGLGDLAAYTQQAPVQIGNRVWLDTDRDGIQDADEPVLVGVTVELVDGAGTVVATAVTDANGEYVFTIAPNTAYTVRLPLNQPALDGLVPTGAGAGSNPLVDSNGNPQATLVLTTIAPHAVGQNDHSFDFGFVVPTPSPSPSPSPSPTASPPPGQPTPSPAPSATPSGYNVAITKTANRATAAVGDEIRYTLTAHNDGPLAAPDVTVRDVVPDALEVTGSKTDKGTCTRKRNVVDCVIGLLAPGADAHVTIVARVVRAGGVTNTATVTAPEDSEVADDVDGATVKARAAKLVVRKAASRRQVTAGRTLRYTLVARNVGDVTARDVRLCDVLPGPLSLVTRGGGRLRGGQLCWTIRSLAPGKSARRSFRVRVDADTPAGTVVNRATVADNGNLDDTDRAPVNVQESAPNPAQGVTG